MAQMFARMIDHDRRVFNVVDLGPGYERFDDPRGEKLAQYRDDITSTTNRRIEIMPWAVPPFSLEGLSSELLSKGYIFDPTWCPTRRMRREYLPEIHEKAVFVLQERNNDLENAVSRVLADLNIEFFVYCSDRTGWDEEMYQRHVGVWEDDAKGIPHLVPAPEELKVDLTIVYCTLADPTGFAVFTGVRDCFDGQVIVIVPTGSCSVADAMAAIRLRAETVLELKDLSNLESAILDAALGERVDCSAKRVYIYTAQLVHCDSRGLNSSSVTTTPPICEENSASAQT